MKDQILEIITLHGGDISLPALIPRLGPDAEGDLWIYAPDIKGQKSGMVMVAGVSDAFLEAFKQLKDEKKIELEPCPFWVSMADGGLYKLPIAKHPRPYKKDHWLPVLIKIVNSTYIKKTPLARSALK